MSGLTISLDINEQDLEQMSDEDLAVIEDQLLLDQELDSSKQARFTAVRGVVFLLMVVGIVILMALFSRLPTSKLGPLNIPLYLIALGGGAAMGHFAWKAAGRTIRNGVRLLLGHWPVVLYVVAQLYSFSR
jgi:hypothetical protein